MTDPVAAAKADYAAALERVRAGRRMVEAGVLRLDLDLPVDEIRTLLRVGLDQVERMVQSALWMRAAEAHRLRVENTPSKVTCLRCLTVVLATDIEDHDRGHNGA